VGKINERIQNLERLKEDIFNYQERMRQKLNKEGAK
jgi:hypothetical protein